MLCGTTLYKYLRDILLYVWFAELWSEENFINSICDINDLCMSNL